MATVTTTFLNQPTSTQMANGSTGLDSGQSTTGIVEALLQGVSSGHVEMDLLDSSGNNLASASGGQMAAIQASRAAARKLFPNVVCTFGAGETQTPTEPARNTLTYDPIPGETGTLVITFSGNLETNTAIIRSDSQTKGHATGTGSVTFTIPWTAA